MEGLPDNHEASESMDASDLDKAMPRFDSITASGSGLFLEGMFLFLEGMFSCPLLDVGPDGWATDDVTIS